VWQQKKYGLSRVGHERHHTVSSQVGVNGDGIRAPHLKGSARVGCRSAADIASLGVEQHRDGVGHPGDDVAQCTQALRPILFVEGEVWGL